MGVGIGICIIGVNGRGAGACGAEEALSEPGVISVMVRIGSATGGVIGRDGFNAETGTAAGRGVAAGRGAGNEPNSTTADLVATGAGFFCAVITSSAIAGIWKLGALSIGRGMDSDCSMTGFGGIGAEAGFTVAFLIGCAGAMDGDAGLCVGEGTAAFWIFARRAEKVGTERGFGADGPIGAFMLTAGFISWTIFGAAAIGARTLSISGLRGAMIL